MTYPDRLTIGSRREVYALDGRGSGEWIVGTLVEWSPDPLKHEIGYMVFRLERAGPRGQSEVIVKCLPGSVGTRMRPIDSSLDYNQHGE